MEKTERQAAFVHNLAETTAELVARKIMDQLREEIGQVREALSRISQTVYGDNGNGLIGQIATINQGCRTRKEECDVAFGLLRAQLAAPKIEVSRWREQLKGAGIAGGAIGGILALLLELHKVLR